MKQQWVRRYVFRVNPDWKVLRKFVCNSNADLSHVNIYTPMQTSAFRMYHKKYERMDRVVSQYYSLLSNMRKKCGLFRTYQRDISASTIYISKQYFIKFDFIRTDNSPMALVYLFLHKCVRTLLSSNVDILNITYVSSKRNSEPVATFNDKWWHWEHGLPIYNMDIFTKTDVKGIGIKERTDVIWQT